MTNLLNSNQTDEGGEGRNLQAWPKFWAVGDSGDILFDPRPEKVSSETKLSRPSR